MRARRLQLYWFPIGTTLAVALAGLLLDLPPRGALVRNGEYGFQVGRFATAPFLGWSIVALAAVWTLQAVTDRPGRPSVLSHHAYYAASGVLYLDLLFLAGAHGRTSAEAGASIWAFAGVIPAAWVGNHVAAKLEDARARSEGAWDDGTRRPALRLARTEAALWTGRTWAWGAPATLWFGGAAAAAGVWLLFWTHGGFDVADVPHLVMFVGFLGYGFATASVQVTVTESAVRVEGGPLRIPFWTIPLDDLVEARVEDVRPMRRYGGYGYRAKGGRRCLIVRAGDGLLLRRRTGRDVLVTVGGAGEGAALLNALLDRRAPASTRPATG